MGDEQSRQFDLRGKLCPYCVMSIIREADMMDAGHTYQFLVDDPLAIKSVPEELEEFTDYAISIEVVETGWEITISRK